MTIDGAHVMIFSQYADADREFARDVLQIPSIDSGGGWLIFKLPPAELGVHPAESYDRHEPYLMCSDIELLIQNLAARDVRCAAPIDEAWGRLTRVLPPGGGTVGMYQPLHPRVAS